MTQPAPDYPYFAFISYSRKDSRAARWLQRRLEWFRVPVKLVEKNLLPAQQRYLRPIYRDKTNLEVDHVHYWENIKRAIEGSRFLIVLCSPDSAQSGPVELEVRHFLETRQNQLTREKAVESLVPVILRGRVSDGPPENRCLGATLQALGATITSRNLPTMVPDDGGNEDEAWETGFIGVASYLLKVRRSYLADHVRREERRQKVIARVISGVMALLLVAAVAAGVQAWKNEQEAMRQRSIAEEKTRETLRALSRADFEYGSEKVEKGQTAEGAAYLTRALRHDSENQAAAFRLFTLLSHRTHWLPSAPAIDVQGAMLEMDYSPDGSKLMVRSVKGGIRMYDSGTGGLVAESFVPNAFQVEVSRFLSSGDVFLIGQDWGMHTPGAQPYPNQSLQILDGTSLKPKSHRLDLGRRILAGATAEVDEGVGLLCQYSIGERDLTVHRLVDGKQTGPMIQVEGRVTRVVLFPDGKSVLVITDKKKIQVFDVTTGKQSGTAVDSTNEVEFEDFRFADGEAWLLRTGRNTFGKRLWQLVRVSDDEAVGSYVDADFIIRDARVDAAAISMIAHGLDGKVRRISLRGTGEALAEPVGHAGVSPAAVRPDFRQIATESSRGVVQLRHLAPRIPGGHALVQTPRTFNAVLSPDGAQLLRTDHDRKVWLQDSLTGSARAAEWQHAEPVNWLGFSVGGKFAASASLEGKVSILDLREVGAQPWQFDCRGTMPALAFDDAQLHVLILTQGVNLQVWNIAERRKIGQCEGLGMVRAFGFLPGGEFYLARGKRVEIWSSAPVVKRREWVVSTGLSDMSAACVDAGITRVAVASEDAGISVWGMNENRQPLLRIPVDGQVKALAFSAAADVLLATFANEVRLYDARSGREAAAAISVRGVRSAGLSPLGHLLLTTAGNQMRLWDWLTGQPVSDELPSTFAASFSADGSRVLHGSQYFCQFLTVPPGTLPPTWLGPLAESVYQERLEADGIRKGVPAQAWLDLKPELAAQQGEDFWSRFGRWFSADPWERPVTPVSADKTIDFLMNQVTSIQQSEKE